MGIIRKCAFNTLDRAMRYLEISRDKEKGGDLALVCEYVV